MTSRKLAALLFTLMLSLFAAASFAQSADSPVTLDSLRERLALTPEQETKIAPLVQERTEKLKALRDSSDPNGSRRDKLKMLRQARGIQQDFVKQVEPLLSQDQKKQWDVLRKEMQENAKERLQSAK